MLRNELEISGVILAGGKGTRMRSPLPKVLHKVLGKTMLQRVLQSLTAAGVKQHCVVLGGELEHFQSIMRNHPNASFCYQQERRGTGDAAATAATVFEGVIRPHYVHGRALSGTIRSKYTLICAGDTPALSGELLREFIGDCQASNATIGVLGFETENPIGYGRLDIDKDGLLLNIIEEKDCSASQKEIRTCNSGVIYCHTATLFQLLDKVEPNNSQKEYYLTDIISLGNKRDLKVKAHITTSGDLTIGVNNPRQLALAESLLRAKHIDSLLRQGVRLHQHATIAIDDSVRIGHNTDIYGPCTLLGSTSIGADCTISPNTYLKNVTLGDHTTVSPGTVASAD